MYCNFNSKVVSAILFSHENKQKCIHRVILLSGIRILEASPASFDVAMLFLRAHSGVQVASEMPR